MPTRLTLSAGFKWIASPLLEGFIKTLSHEFVALDQRHYCGFVATGIVQRAAEPDEQTNLCNRPQLGTPLDKGLNANVRAGTAQQNNAIENNELSG
jgi:hypothetical protein